MGFDLCWVGVEARRRKRLLDWFALEPAGEADDELASDFVMAETAEGWVILAARAPGFDVDEALAGVSVSCGFAVGGQIVDDESFSRSSASRNGRPLWSVTYNDAGTDSLEATGDFPREFNSIKARLTAEQSGSYLFEAPADTAACVTGYRPGDDPGLEWTILRKRQPKSVPVSCRPRSLRAAMTSDLIPLLRSLDWKAPDRPDLATIWQIGRTLEGVEQTIWFEYASGQETYVVVHFYARACSGRPEFEVGGRVTAPRVTLPLWKRFTWKRLSELTRYEPPPADIIGAVIERAGDEIRIADEYLRNWVRSPCILIDFSQPRAEWPTP